MIMKGNTKDIFQPTAWASPKALCYWKNVAAQDLMAHLKQMEGFIVRSMKGK